MVSISNITYEVYEEAYHRQDMKLCKIYGEVLLKAILKNYASPLMSKLINELLILLNTVKDEYKDKNSPEFKDALSIIGRVKITLFTYRRC